MAKKSVITQPAHPMKNVSDAWLAKIEMALKVRDEEFGVYAEEAMNFFDGDHNWMWQDSYTRGNSGFLDKQGGSLPTFRISVNKLFEAVAYFGPAMYSQNPNALVEAIKPAEVAPEALGIMPDDFAGMEQYGMIAQQDAMQFASRQACASVKTVYLNWIQRETDKKTEARRAITETLVAGVGYMETTMHTPPGSEMVMPRSRYVSWYDVVHDPDASYYEDVQWTAIRRMQPVNKAEKRFGREPGTFKGQYQSFASQPSSKAKKEARSNRSGKSFDQMEYWDVYSKNGFGDLLFDDREIPSAHQFDYSVFGDYCYISCSKGSDGPLNVPVELLTQSEDPSELFKRVQWPIPFWYDDGGWPVSRLWFYDKPNSIHPISIFKPAIGELRFINWCLSFLADKVAASCQTYVGILKSAGAEIQRQIGGKNTPFTVIDIAAALDKPLDQIISFLQAPNFSIDIWKMIAEVLQLIDRRTGLTELFYGIQATQDRSAAISNIKDQNNSVRPDDMASKVDDWLSEIEVREMQAARWFCEPKDIAPAVGQLGALVWQNYVLTDDVDSVVRGYDYTIEAGSARRPNKAGKVQALTEIGQYTLPVLQQAALAGNVGPWNAYMTLMGKNLDMDLAGMLLPEPDPNQPSPEEQELQAEMQLKVAELELKMKEMEAKLQMEREKLDMEREKMELELEHEKDMHGLDMKAKYDEIVADKEQAKVDIDTSKKIGAAKAKQASKPKPKPKK
jgi:hypothetical protein